MRVLAGVGILLATVLTTNNHCLGQSCPDWSPKFDKVTNPEAKAKLEAMTNWDQIVAQSGGAATIIVTFQSNLKDAKTQRDNAMDVIKKISSGPGDPMDFTVSWDQCKEPTSALMAAQCEYKNMTGLIASLEGFIDLAQCRLDKGQ
jgi:hypothetical protein